MKRIILILISILLFLPQFILANSNLNSAIDWIKQNQNESGLIGNNEFEMSPALIALWLYEGNSSNVTKGFEYLNGTRAEDGSWFYSSTDITGLILYAFSLTNHISLLNDYGMNTVNWLLSQQGTNGGFASWGEVSSENTAYALLGLLNVNAIPDQNKSTAVNYILSLQNPDGSINRTETDMTGYSGLGPEYYTALSLIALNEAGIYNESTTQALNYLKEKSEGYFRDQNHSFLAALSSLAFSRYNEKDSVSNSINYLKSLQMLDGGFVDSSRFNPNVSNALDTGWAAIALQKVTPLIKVGVLISFPNGTTFAHCLQLLNGSTAEDALKASGMKTLWASFSFGDALTKIEDVGCPTSDPWCQCSNMNVCCLLWNFWILNSTNQWEFSQVGFGDYKLKDKDVFGNIWASDAGKSPPLFLFDEICPDGFTINNNSFVGVYTCDSTTTTITTTSVEVTTTIVEHGGSGMITTTTTQTTVPTTTTSIQTTTSSIFSPVPTTTNTVITNVTNNQLKSSPLTGFATFIISPVGIGIIVAIVVLAFFVYLMLPER